MGLVVWVLRCEVRGFGIEYVGEGRNGFRLKIREQWEGDKILVAKQ